mgnify:CR=1 FL=1
MASRRNVTAVCKRKVRCEGSLISKFDSADCLARAKLLLNRPTTDEAISDANWYTFLSDAQDRVYDMMAAHCPEPLYSAPTKLTTADSGATYSFGTDVDTAQIFAYGHVELRASKTGRQILPGNDWDDTTERFIIDSEKLRWPGQRTRTFDDGPYARFIAPPGVISGSVAPTLQPKNARRLLVFDACSRAAEQRLKQDPSPYSSAFDRAWVETLFALKTRYYGEGLRAMSDGSSGLWWRASF